MQNKKQKNITAKRLENIAVYYLSRYESSIENLKNVLRRRVEKARFKEADVPDNADEIINEIVAKMVSLGYVDDTRFKENLIRKMKESGKSLAQIRQKMMQSGIGDEMMDIQYDEEAAAAVFVRKKRLGTNPENYINDLAKLSRAGFSRSVAEKALKS